MHTNSKGKLWQCKVGHRFLYSVDIAGRKQKGLTLDYVRLQ